MVGIQVETTSASRSRRVADLPRTPPDALIDHLARELQRPVSPEVERLVLALRQRFGSSLIGVLLYGSCLHHGDLTEGLVDLYALVDSYRKAYKRWIHRLWASLLPPNVFYFEDAESEPRLRGKYAVMSLPHFQRGCRDWFHPYLWARFAQPARLVFARDEVAQAQIPQVLASAVVRFLTEVVPLCGPGSFEASTIWSVGLARTYASELRPERDRAGLLVRVHGTDFERVTSLAASAVPRLTSLPAGAYRTDADSFHCRKARIRWRLRRWQGLILSVSRLLKGVFTFENALDYAAWKVERHSGEKISVTPSMRKHPVFHGLRILHGLLRRRIVR